MMKKILYFDCSSGISGDMTLGALLHLGADIERLRAELGKLEVTGYSLVARKRQKNGVTGVDLDVVIGDGIREEKRAKNREDVHGETGHDHGSYSSIRAMIENSGLSDKVKRMASAIFAVIAEAEAAVHDLPPEQVIFHEVGAVDSIVDIVGTAICVDMLGVDEIHCSPVHDGSGFIGCRHGLIPVPAPAVIEMLKGSGIRIITEDVDTEMVTPTGIGILKGLRAKCGRMPEISVLGAGYGFGKRDTGRFNAVRIVMGRIEESGGSQAKPEPRRAGGDTEA